MTILRKSRATPGIRFLPYFNQGLNVTFFDLIKDDRVKEYQRLCREPAMSGEKILTLALSSGFYSKPAFNRASSGSGLGLSIVREIMSLHGGSFKIANCTDGVRNGEIPCLIKV